MTREEAIINLKLSQNRIGGMKKEEWNALQMAIKALQTEAVEVVRCKDCKHWHEWENATGSCLRSENGCNWFGPDAIDYCSFGERKNDSE